MTEVIREKRMVPWALFWIILLLCSLGFHLFYRTSKSVESVVRPGTFKVMTYNVKQYALMDRDGDGDSSDPKPKIERDAVIQVILDEKPDVLLIEEMGDESVFQELCSALRIAGMDYPHQEYLHRGRSPIALALLSTFPITERHPHISDLYSVGSAKLPVLRGFIDVDIQVTTNYAFKLIGAHLKSKVFHPMGQTEMRRNEARLLNKHVRQFMRKHPEQRVLVAGDLNDGPSSATYREAVGKKTPLLFDLRPGDRIGAVWTHADTMNDIYSRIDYILVNSVMFRDVVTSSTHLVHNQNTLIGSDHRPVVAVFNYLNPSPVPSISDEDAKK